MNCRYSSSLRLVGSFDLTVTAILAVPGLSHAFIWLVDWIGVATGIAVSMPPFPPFAMLMVNLAGVFGFCWNLLILRTASSDMVKISIAARWIVAALIVYYVATQSVSPVVLLFAGSEIIGSLVEFGALRSRKAQSQARATMVVS